MLYRINGRGQDVPVTKMIFPKDYQRVRAAMTPAETAAVVDEINRLTDKAGAEIITTSWLNGVPIRGMTYFRIN